MTTVRSSRASNRVALLLVTMIVALCAAVSAHRRDEYLQAARIGIAPDRVELELDLTPGIAVADLVIGEIDEDGNGVLSSEEQHAYARQVLSAITLHIDDTPPHQLELAASHFPDVAAMRSGDVAITIRSDLIVPSLAAGPHRLLFRNQHATATSVYLANALLPESDRVAVTGQGRDGDQSELTVEFVVRGASSTSGRRMWVTLAAGLVLAISFIRRRRRA